LQTLPPGVFLKRFPQCIDAVG